MSLPKSPSQMTTAQLVQWLNIATPTSPNHDLVLHEWQRRQADRQYWLALWGVIASNTIAATALLVALIK